MTVFNDFSETGQFLGTRDEPLNGSNISRYVAEHTEERVKGYAECLSDMIQLLGPKLWTHYDPSEGASGQWSSRRRNVIPMIELFEDQSELLKQLLKTTTLKPSADSSEPT